MTENWFIPLVLFALLGLIFLLLLVVRLRYLYKV